jgi:hypothetical protein
MRAADEYAQNSDLETQIEQVKNKGELSEGPFSPCVRRNYDAASAIVARR